MTLPPDPETHQRLSSVRGVRRAAEWLRRWQYDRRVPVEYMQLTRADRARYFAPTMICGYVMTLCAALIVTSAFLRALPDVAALTAAGVFGFILSGGLGLILWRAQRRDLRFVRLKTPHDASNNYLAVRAAVERAGWKVTNEDPDRQLQIETAQDIFAAGDHLVVKFRGREVLIAGICDPGVGFSLVGRRRCAANCDWLRGTVLSDFPDALTAG